LLSLKKEKLEMRYTRVKSGEELKESEGRCCPSCGCSVRGPGKPRRPMGSKGFSNIGREMENVASRDEGVENTN